MGDFLRLLRTNRNYRRAWLGQIVSEIGDHFNTIAVFALVLERTGSGVVVSLIMLARAVPMILAGPIAGVALDRMDRKRLMIASDLARALFGALFVFAVSYEPIWPLYVLSAMLMFASPFFTSGRTAILPTIARPDELHAANSLTQTTRALTVTLGTLLGGVATAALGYEAAFVINAASFLFSGWMVSLLKVEGGGFRPARKALTEEDVARPWREYREGLCYLRRRPLLFGIALLGVGWAAGGGAAQILFSLFGEQVFGRGAAGIGGIWSAAGVGLLAGSLFAHWLAPRLDFAGYKRAVAVSYLIHGLTYVAFSQAPSFAPALAWVALSRFGMGVSSTLNNAQLLVHVDDGFRGRVYSTIESMIWGTMMLSLSAAGWASDNHSPREVGAWAGGCGVLAGLIWIAADRAGKLPEPARCGGDPDDYEVRSRYRV